jgi:16S rRNA (cytosine1402-N4)-methyltransferase
LKVKNSFHHQTVLLKESVEEIVTDPSGIYVDCTLGGGGHSAAILSRLNANGMLVGIDRDPAAVEAGKEKLADSIARVRVVQGNFFEIATILDDLQVDHVNGILFDLGVSSHQLDVPDRGFSYMHDGPLDMRMDPAQPFSACELVNQYTETELARVIFEYGEERWARRIASFIVAARARSPVTTTAELTAIIAAAIPAAARRQGHHPAKRTFQALRIEVNGELKILPGALRAAVDKLATGGRLGIITFHSLEDRIAKQFFLGLTGRCTCPPKSPICICNPQAVLRVRGKPILPTTVEIDANPRARSAKLRIAEKI